MKVIIIQDTNIHLWNVRIYGFLQQIYQHLHQWEVSEAWQPHLSHSHLDQVQSTFYRNIHPITESPDSCLTLLLFLFYFLYLLSKEDESCQRCSRFHLIFFYCFFFHFSSKFTNKKGHFSFKSTTTNHIIQTYFTPIWLRPITAGRLIRLKPSIIFRN